MFARRFIAVLLCLGSIAGMKSLAVWWNGTAIIRTDDRNHDGQPDVWERNPNADESVVAIDTNFDGRPDQRFRYRSGNLVSLETDSDFDNRVDIVEDYDPTTHEVVRSLIDIDKDGKADLLVLSHNGQPVFKKWADQVVATDANAFSTRHVTDGAVTPSANPASDDGDLIPLADPFVGDVAMRGTRPWRSVHRDSFLSTSGGLPSPATVISGVRSSVSVRETAFHFSARLAVAQASPRGPPIFSTTPLALL